MGTSPARPMAEYRNISKRCVTAVLKAAHRAPLFLLCNDAELRGFRMSYAGPREGAAGWLAVRQRSAASWVGASKAFFGLLQ
jgi:hypothetical protein